MPDSGWEYVGDHGSQPFASTFGDILVAAVNFSSSELTPLLPSPNYTAAKSGEWSGWGWNGRHKDNLGRDVGGMLNENSYTNTNALWAHGIPAGFKSGDLAFVHPRSLTLTLNP